MTNNHPNATIADIARRAGVGTATVDRVLNGRPGVNSITTEKVMAAVKALGEPTVMRGRPRKGDSFRFVYVLPAGGSALFDRLERVIAQAAGEFRHQHITQVTLRIPAQDPAHFAAELSKVSDCDALVVVAPDLPAIKLVINEKVRAGVHVVTLLSDVAGSMREAFVGADNRAAGRTAGLLLARMAQAPQRDTLLLLSQATRMSGEIERCIGFAQVIEERFPHLKVQHCLDLPSDDESVYEAMHQVLTRDFDISRLAGAYNVGQGSSGVATALAQLVRQQNIGLVAHGFTAQHQAMLVSGALTYVLHQDLHYGVIAAARVLRGLCENVRGALNVVQPRVEILTAENLH